EDKSERAVDVIDAMRKEEKLLDDIAAGNISREVAEGELHKLRTRIERGYEVNPKTGIPVLHNQTDYRRFLDEKLPEFKTIFDPVNAIAKTHGFKTKEQFLETTGF